MDISTSILSAFYNILLGKGIASGLLSIPMHWISLRNRCYLMLNLCHNGILLLKNKIRSKAYSKLE